MVMYLDVILALNVGIDWLLLWMTAHFRCRKVKWYRFLLGALLGSSFVLLAFVPALSFLYTFWLKIVCSMLMIGVTFGYHRWRTFFQNVLMFYFISFVTGGGLLAAHYLLQTRHEVMAGIVYTQTAGYGDPVAWTFLLIGIPVMWWLSRKGYQAMEEPKQLRTYAAQVEVEMMETRIRCRGLIDTGNRLYEPFTRVPVMIMEATALADILPAEMKPAVCREGSNVDHSFVDRLDSEWRERLRFIPYRGVAQGMHFLIAVKPDKVVITKGDEVYHPRKVLIGLNPQSLASDGSYRCIIHPALLDNARQAASF